MTDAALIPADAVTGPGAVGMPKPPSVVIAIPYPPATQVDWDTQATSWPTDGPNCGYQVEPPFVVANAIPTAPA